MNQILRSPVITLKGLFFALLLLSSTMSIAGIYDDVQIGADFSLATQYIDRAVPLSKTLVVQPSIWANLGQAQAFVWSNVPFKPKDKIFEKEDGWKYPTEIRLSALYKFKVDNFAIEPKFTYYEFSPKHWSDYLDTNLKFSYSYFFNNEIESVFFTNQSYVLLSQQNLWNKMYYSDYGAKLNIKKIKDIEISPSLSFGLGNKKYDEKYFTLSKKKSDLEINNISTNAMFTYMLDDKVFVKTNLMYTMLLGVGKDHFDILNTEELKFNNLNISISVGGDF